MAHFSVGGRQQWCTNPKPLAHKSITAVAHLEVNSGCFWWCWWTDFRSAVFTSTRKLPRVLSMALGTGQERLKQQCGYDLPFDVISSWINDTSDSKIQIHCSCWGTRSWGGSEGTVRKRTGRRQELNWTFRHRYVLGVERAKYSIKGQESDWIQLFLGGEQRTS